MPKLTNTEEKYFNKMCGMVCMSADESSAVFTMPITPDLFQPFGYLHGGATCALLEAAASQAAALRAKENEHPFGINVNVWHKSPGISGVVTGTAALDREETRSSKPGRKQYWNVRATDDTGRTLSEGTVITMIVPDEYLNQKQKEK